MGHLINVEVINTIQMLDACKVCAASMTEGFQRDVVLDSLLRGSGCASPGLGLCFCYNLLLEFECHLPWEALHDCRRQSLVLLWVLMLLCTYFFRRIQNILLF